MTMWCVGRGGNTFLYSLRPIGKSPNGVANQIKLQVCFVCKGQQTVNKPSRIQLHDSSAAAAATFR